MHALPGAQHKNGQQSLPTTPPDPQKLCVGTRLWGMVLEVSERGLAVSLPHGLRGHVTPSEVRGGAGHGGGEGEGEGARGRRAEGGAAPRTTPVSSMQLPSVPLHRPAPGPAAAHTAHPSPHQSHLAMHLMPQASDVLAQLHDAGSKRGAALRASLTDSGAAPPTLSSLFHVGQYVRCCVVSLGSGEEGGAGEGEDSKLRGKKGQHIGLSLRLSKVCKGLAKEGLTPGTAVPAVVRNVEDHGYMLGLGIKVGGWATMCDVPAFMDAAWLGRPCGVEAVWMIHLHGVNGGQRCAFAQLCACATTSSCRPAWHAGRDRLPAQGGSRGRLRGGRCAVHWWGRGPPEGSMPLWQGGVHDGKVAPKRPRGPEGQSLLHSPPSCLCPALAPLGALNGVYHLVASLSQVPWWRWWSRRSQMPGAWWL